MNELQLQQQEKKTMRERRIELWKARVLKARLKGEKPPKYGQTVLTKIKILMHRLTDAEINEVTDAVNAIKEKRKLAHQEQISKLIPFVKVGDSVHYKSGAVNPVSTVFQRGRDRHVWAFTVHGMGYYAVKGSPYALNLVADIPAARTRMELAKAAKRRKK